MRRVVVVSLAGVLLLVGAAESMAKKIPCKDVRAAIAAGKTPEQVAEELGAKPRRVKACMSRGEKGGKAKQAAGAKQTGASPQASPAAAPGASD